MPKEKGPVLHRWGLFLCTYWSDCSPLLGGSDLLAGASGFADSGFDISGFGTVDCWIGVLSNGGFEPPEVSGVLLVCGF